MFLSSGFVVDYYLCMETYLEQCVNKDKPKLQCNGKCMLAQKINDSQPEDSESREICISLSVEYLFDVFEFHAIEQNSQRIHSSTCNSSYQYSKYNKLYKPPILG